MNTQQGQSQLMSNATQSYSAEHTLATLQSLSYHAGQLHSYLDGVCEVLLSLLGDGLCAVTLYRDGANQILAQRSELGSLPPTAYDIHGQLSTHVVNFKTILKVEDTTQTQAFGQAPEGYYSYMGIPLRIPSGEVVGTLCYFHRAKRKFTDQDQQTAELFAERVAIALDNYHIYRKLEEYSDSLEALVRERTELLLAARDQLSQQEKAAAVGDFATQITHEIRNPLATIRLALEYQQQNPGKTSAKRVEVAIGEVERLERLLNEVLLYSGPKKVDSVVVDLSSFCRDFVATYASPAGERQQQLSFLVDKPARIVADRDKLTQILLNLLRNACEAADFGQTITLTVSQEKDYGVIAVHNFGDSIPADRLPHITEVFVSGKPNGSGLGLAIVSSLLQAQGGRIDFASSDVLGTTATVYLPLEVV